MSDDKEKPSPPQVPDNKETTTGGPEPDPKTTFEKDN